MDNPYLSLITSEHKRRPRYRALVDALTAPLAATQSALDALAKGFDLDTAQGVQLDQIGLWAGVARTLRQPLEGVFFSLDVSGLGMDEGVWKGPYDPDAGLVSLPDEFFRLLIRARIAANHWDGTVPGAYTVWETVFSGSKLIMQDYQDMSMAVGIVGMRLNAVLQGLLTDGYLPLKPAGVRVTYYIVGAQTGPFFGLDAENEALQGFDVGQWPEAIYTTE